MNFFANYPTSGAAAGSNPSVGPNGFPAPVESTEIGFIDGSGNLQGVSAANPLPITIESEVGTLNVNISQYGGVATTLGQKASASSAPVVIASDQSAVPVSQSGIWNINNVSGTVSLPTGASTSALQTTGNSTLSSILANQTNGAQHTIVDSSALPTGAATQATLASILTNQTNGTQVVSQSSGANLHVNIDNFPGTQPISGTVTSNQGTSPWVENVSQFGGNPVVTGTGASGAGIPRVTVSSDSSVHTVPQINTNGSVSNSITVTNTSATTFTPPANAVGFVVESESSNTVNLRYACGTTATTSVGMLLEPGRDSGYIPSSGTVTVICATAATNQAASIQWVLTS
jgi:hypothetical protein